MKQSKTKRFQITKSAYAIIALAVLLTGLACLILFSSAANQDAQKQLPTYVGLTESEAKTKAKKDGLIYRDVSPENSGALTGDFRSDRVNVTIQDGIVREAKKD